MLAYVDTSIWIAYIEGPLVYQKAIEHHLVQMKQAGWKLCVSKAVIMEALYKPYRDQNNTLINAYSRLFSKMQILPNYTNLFETD